MSVVTHTAVKPKMMTLADACLMITDGAHNSPATVNEGLPMASVKDLTRFGINLDTCRRVSVDDYKTLERQGCKPQVGDILIAKDGATALDTVCIYQQEEQVVLLSSVAILRPNSKIIMPAYLRYYLDSPQIRQYMKNAFITGAAIPRVVLQDFKRTKIAVPSLEEQARATSILKPLDDLIAINLRRIKVLEALMRAIYNNAFGNQKAKQWARSALQQVASVNPESITSRNHPDEIDYIDISSVGTGRINRVQHMQYSEAPSRARRIVRDGDIIWATVRPNRRQYSYLDNPSSNTIVSTGFAVLRAKSIPVSYLYLLMSSDNTIAYLVNHATGAAYPAVNSDVFMQMQIPVPPKQLLHTFDESVAPLLNETQQLLKNCQTLGTMRDLLLPGLVTTELGDARE